MLVIVKVDILYFIFVRDFSLWKWLKVNHNLELFNINAPLP